jgi:hypothetical protein
MRLVGALAACPGYWRSREVNDNFHGMIEALKQAADRLIQEIRRRLFGSGGADDPYQPVVKR